MFDDYREYGIVFGVLITILLSVKDVLHKFIDEAKEVEWNDTLKFAIIALVILPLLPEKITLPFFPYGQYYDLNVFYPKEIWLLIVFILGVSFFGYFLIKIIGGKKGANLIGALGGIVSSTAVTQSMAVHSKTFVKKKVGKNLPLISATLLASLMAFARAGLISSSINRDLMPILLPVATVILIGIIMFIFLMRRTESYKTSLKLESPLNIKPAFTLGVLYAILTFLSKLSFATNLGRSGVILGAFVTGLFDIDPVILTVSTLSATSTITSLDAIISIIVAVGANLITKTMIVLSTGSRFFARTMALIFLTFVIILFGWLLYFEPI